MVRRRRAYLGGAALMVVAAAVIVVLSRSGHGSGHDLRTGRVRIPVSGGAQVQAQVTVPPTVSKPALVVMPAAWNFPIADYSSLTHRLVAAGYAVVSYAQRGQGTSTGTVDFAGQSTQADVSKVIDWSLAHTGADPRRIGMWGTSYGGAAALLGASSDRRIRAVVALSTWSDLSATLVPNGTVASETLSGLLTGARLDDAWSRVRTSLGTDPKAVAAQVRALSPSRSPVDQLDRLNRNGAAILLGDGFEDHVTVPGPLITFYDALTTPKRLELQGGDHGGPGYDGLLGKPDITTDDGVSWLSHFLRGADNGIDSGAQIAVRDVVTQSWRRYDTWPTASAADVFDLDAPNTPGNISLSPAAWSSSLTTGTDSTATSGTGASYPPVQTMLGTPTPQFASTWIGSPVPGPTQVTGSPRVRLSVGASVPSASFFAYLYDVNPSGVATLMSFAPDTVGGLTPGVLRSVDLALEPIAWTLPAADRLELVIDTADPRYLSSAVPGSTLSLASSASASATVTIPLG